MNHEASQPEERHDLRRKAEAIVLKKVAQAPANIEALPPDEIRQPLTELFRQTLHDLQVHQIELELQNEELRRAQVDLEASRASYFDLYDLAPVGYCTVSESGLILEANLTIATMLGQSRGALVKQPMSSYFWPEDQDLYYHFRRQLFDAGAQQACELRMVREDKSILWANLEATAARDSTGMTVSRITISDITARKHAEEERLRLEEQLAEVQKLESVGRLAGGVAHFLNNMMSVVIGYSELALSKLTPSDPVHRNVGESLEAAKRSAAMVRQLLAFAQKQIVALRVVDLNEFVTGMVKKLEMMAGGDIQVSWQPQAELWPVKLDPVQIDQMLESLCSNSCDAIDGAGKILIETSAAEFDEEYCSHHAGFAPGQYVRLAVSDDGSGMDKETLTHLFEPFFTTKGVGKGTGLGLATVYGIIKQNNGLVHVESEPGKGSTFSIYLPRHVV